MYESSADRASEQEVADRVARAWECNLYKLPIHYGWDYGGFRGGDMRAVFEVKVRGKKYTTLFISLHKVMRGYEFAAIDIRPYLIVSWPDGVYWLDITKAPLTIKWGGRKDRGDPQDMEPVAHFGVELFSRFK